MALPYWCELFHKCPASGKREILAAAAQIPAVLARLVSAALFQLDGLPLGGGHESSSEAVLWRGIVACGALRGCSQALATGNAQKVRVPN